MGLRTSKKGDWEIFLYLHERPKCKRTALTLLSDDGSNGSRNALKILLQIRHLSFHRFDADGGCLIPHSPALIGMSSTDKTQADDALHLVDERE